MPFSLKLEASAEDIGAAAFHALVASAWVMFETMQMLWLSRRSRSSVVPLELRERWAHTAFDLVGGNLPEASPYARELRRYVDEEVPLILGKRTPESTPTT
jgi:hypothetical protein